MLPYEQAHPDDLAWHGASMWLRAEGASCSTVAAGQEAATPAQHAAPGTSPAAVMPATGRLWLLWHASCTPHGLLEPSLAAQPAGQMSPAWQCSRPQCPLSPDCHGDAGGDVMGAFSEPVISSEDELNTPLPSCPSASTPSSGAPACTVWLKQVCRREACVTPVHAVLLCIPPVLCIKLCLPEIPHRHSSPRCTCCRR